MATMDMAKVFKGKPQETLAMAVGARPWMSGASLSSQEAWLSSLCCGRLEEEEGEEAPPRVNQR